MTEHVLKTHPTPYEAMADGIKAFEIRKEGDRVFAVGDILVLKEWDPVRAKAGVEADGFTGKWMSRVVTYIVRGPEWQIPAGMVILGVRKQTACSRCGK